MPLYFVLRCVFDARLHAFSVLQAGLWAAIVPKIELHWSCIREDLGETAIGS